jgi:hypothetical protein
VDWGKQGQEMSLENKVTSKAAGANAISGAMSAKASGLRLRMKTSNCLKNYKVWCGMQDPKYPLTSYLCAS